MKNSTIDLLYGILDACFIEPKGDPNRSNLYPAACVAKILIEEGYSMSRVYMRQLRKDNMYNHDFLKEVEEDFGPIKRKKKRAPLAQ
jgi:hypothetical protein